MTAPDDTTWTSLERANVEALRARCRARTRDGKATKKESSMLRRWAGWGTIQRLFTSDSPENLRQTVQKLVTPSEFNAGSQAATLNAHWTPPEVAAEVWTAVIAFAEITGREVRSVLEPSCGIGEFLAPAPQTVKKMTGIEIDPVTADIARLLFPAAHVHTESFATVDLSDEHFDFCVGNLPFSQEILTDHAHNTRRLPVPEHFLLKAAHLVRPGGLLALIVPHRLMDTPDARARRQIAELAQLAAAIRFSSHRWDAIDGPGVIADLLVLRRRSPGSTLAPKEPAWMNVATIPGSAVQINEYFIHHPEFVMGDITASGASMKVIADSNGPHARLPQVLADALLGGRGTV